MPRTALGLALRTCATSRAAARDIERASGKMKSSMGIDGKEGISPTFTGCKSDCCASTWWSEDRLPKLAAGGVDVVAPGITRMGDHSGSAEDLRESGDAIG